MYCRSRSHLSAGIRWHMDHLLLKRCGMTVMVPHIHHCRGNDTAAVTGVRSCISLGGSRATGNVSLVKFSVSSSLLLLESKTTRKQEKSGTRPNYHQNSLGITFRHIVWFYKYKDEAKLHLLQKKQKKNTKQASWDRSNWLIIYLYITFCQKLFGNEYELFLWF